MFNIIITQYYYIMRQCKSASVTSRNINHKPWLTRVKFKNQAVDMKFIYIFRLPETKRDEKIISVFFEISRHYVFIYIFTWE